MKFLTKLKEKKNIFIKKENIYLFILIIVIFLCDRFTKLKVISSFNDNIIYINDYINLDLIWNIGIGFGFFSTQSSLFYNLITILIGLVIIFLVYVFLSSKKIDKFIYSIIIGGALGNFYDRVTFNAVPDFIDLHYNNFHWFTFNVADIFITLGVITYILKNFFVKE